MGRPIILVISLAVLMAIATVQAHDMNVIDKCWRADPNWKADRQKLASCSVGFAGKMVGNTGPDVQMYEVTDPGDDPLNPCPGQLRYGTTQLKGKVWITFAKDMQISLQKPLLLKNCTTIDGRGANVHITCGCLLIKSVSNIIIHGIKISGCKPHPAGELMGPEGKVTKLGPTDGDAIRIMSSSKIWIDHCTLQECEDGLCDVTKGSTDVTVSNNHLMLHNKCMLFGHADECQEDKIMKVTVAFNHFGPKCNQRLPRVRFGYAHVVNNFYEGWGIYAIGGTMAPTVESQGNLFVAEGKKEVVWDDSKDGKYKSVNDVLENGAKFTATVKPDCDLSPKYTPEQLFEVADGNAVKALTSCAGALNCSSNLKC